MIDTNVLVSAAINPYGSPGRLMDAVLAEGLTVLHDDRILNEYREVLTRPRFGFALADVGALLDFIESAGEHISTRDLGVILPDASDLPFLEVAALGRADALITGNLKHFKPRRGKHSVYICTPAEFLKVIHRSRLDQ